MRSLNTHHLLQYSTYSEEYPGKDEQDLLGFGKPLGAEPNFYSIRNNANCRES